LREECKNFILPNKARITGSVTCVFLRRRLGNPTKTDDMQIYPRLSCTEYRPVCTVWSRWWSGTGESAPCSISPSADYLLLLPHSKKQKMCLPTSGVRSISKFAPPINYGLGQVKSTAVNLVLGYIFYAHRGLHT